MQHKNRHFNAKIFVPSIESNTMQYTPAEPPTVKEKSQVTEDVYRH